VKRKGKKYETPKANTLVLNCTKDPRSLEDLIQSLESQVPGAMVRETVWDLMDQGKIRLTWDRKLVAG
jgi:hypothetical protein